MAPVIDVWLEPSEVVAGHATPVELVARNHSGETCYRVVLRRRVAPVSCVGAQTVRVERLPPGEEIRLGLTIPRPEPGQYPIPIAGVAWETERGEVIRARPEPPLLTVLPRSVAPEPARQRVRPTVFVSYRTVDTEDVLPAVLGELEDPGLAVFSTQDIRAADHWPAVLRHELLEASVLVALVGRHWLTASTLSGRRLLDVDGDWVRVEIATALSRRIPVLTLLIDGASVPDRDELPSDLAGLAEHQGMRWRPGSGDLLRSLRRLTA